MKGLAIMQRSSFFKRLLRDIARSCPRFSIGNLVVAGTLFMMACTDYGQLGCDGHCTHPWDGTEGSCPLAGGAVRQVGGPCGGWPGPACDTGGRCVDGTCLGCGVDGEVCCTLGTSQVCNSGTCVSSDDFAKCDDSCGLLTPGKDSCCPGTGTKCSQGVCNIDTNKCIQPASDPCTGNNPYSVLLTDSNGCAQGPFFFTANNDTEAQTCVDQLKASWGAVSACALNQAAQETDVCGTSILGSSTFIIDVCDNAQFASCEHAQCTNCNFTNGACP